MARWVWGIVFIWGLVLFYPNEVRYAYADVKSEKSFESDQLIIINKHDNSLTFYKGGHKIRSFSVATGRVSSFTPEGDFHVVNRVENMPYYKDKIPGGDPRNPLGNRWIGLDVPGTQGFTYGMHGTNAEWSIGSYASSGCVRMYNSEVRWLFERIEVGARVLILREDASANNIAKSNNYKVYKNESKEPENVYSLTPVMMYGVANGDGKTILPPLVSMQVVAQQGDWLQVRLSTKEKGWIKDSYHYKKEQQHISVLSSLTALYGKKPA